MTEPVFIEPEAEPTETELMSVGDLLDALEQADYPGENREHYKFAKRIAQAIQYPLPESVPATEDEELGRAVRRVIEKVIKQK